MSLKWDKTPEWENTKILLDASMNVGQKVNAEKTKSRNKTAGQSHNSLYRQLTNPSKMRQKLNV